MKLGLLIPAYQPDDTLFQIVRDTIACFARARKLKDYTIKVVIVNDCSTQQCALDVFAKIKRDLPQITIIDRDENGGQGASLKTGFKWINENYPDIPWVVTGDADGQHLPHDICSLFIRGVTNHFSKTVLGVRDFGSDVPFRSRIGNIVTSKLVGFLYGHKIKDTQTGLRGFPKKWFNILIKKKSNRFNFNSEVLVHLMQTEGFEQHNIATVYEPGNPSSHFRPLVDSMQIYSVILRYSSVMLLVALLEIINFSIFSKIFSVGIAPLVIAKSLSIALSFTLLRKFVFNSAASITQMVTYFCLSLGHLIGVWFLFEFLYFHAGVTFLLSTITAYFSMFFIVYWVQRSFIFKSKWVIE